MPDVSRAARVCVGAGNLDQDRLSFAPRWPRRQSAERRRIALIGGAIVTFQTDFIVMGHAGG